MKYKYIKNKGKCPLCNSEKKYLLYSIKSEDIARYIVPPTKPHKFHAIIKALNSISKEGLFKKNFCEECKLIFCTPFTSGNSEFYTAMYKNENYIDWKWDYEVAFNKIKRLPKNKRKNLLEIGAGNGSFVKRLHPFVKKKNISCLEYSDNGIREIKKNGIANVNKDLLTTKFNEKFSIICMFQVLEHMDNIDLVFNKISHIAKKGANIFITTPFPKTIMFFENSGTSLDLPPAHIAEYSKKTFEFICKKYGFKMEDFQKQKYNFFLLLLGMGLGMFNINKMRGKKIECFIEGLSNKKIKKYLIMLYLILLSPSNLLKIIFKKMYVTQFIHLVKT